MRNGIIGCVITGVIGAGAIIAVANLEAPEASGTTCAKYPPGSPERKKCCDLHPDEHKLCDVIIPTTTVGTTTTVTIVTTTSPPPAVPSTTTSLPPVGETTTTPPAANSGTLPATE